MAVELTGPFGSPQKHLHAAIAASAAFRAAVGANDAAGAAPFVHVYCVDDREEIDGQCNANFRPPPRAIAWLVGGELVQSAHGVWQWDAGIVTFAIHLPIAEDDMQPENGTAISDGGARFLNAAGPIIREILDLSNSGGYLALTRPRIHELAQAYTEGDVPLPYFSMGVSAEFRGLF